MLSELSYLHKIVCYISKMFYLSLTVSIKQTPEVDSTKDDINHSIQLWKNHQHTQKISKRQKVTRAEHPTKNPQKISWIGTESVI